MWTACASGKARPMPYVVFENQGNLPGGNRQKVTAFQQWRHPLVVSEKEQIGGVIELQDIIKPGIQERFQRLRKNGYQNGDGYRRQSADRKIHCQQSGVDDFIAEKPEDKMNYIRKEQRKAGWWR